MNNMMWAEEHHNSNIFLALKHISFSIEYQRKKKVRKKKSLHPTKSYKIQEMSEKATMSAASANNEHLYLWYTTIIVV